jgi:transposase-like protein
MKRRGEEYWRKAIKEQAESGMSAARYCRKHQLQRGTFLRWRRRLGADGPGGHELVEIGERAAAPTRCVESTLELRLAGDIRIAVHSGTDLSFVGSLIAAIRRAI